MHSEETRVDGRGNPDLATPGGGQPRFKALLVLLGLLLPALPPGSPRAWLPDTPLEDADASYIGEGQNDYASRSFARAGDVNGDGYDDFLVGAWANSEYGSQTGQTYLILGKASGWTPDLSLADADASFIGEEVISSTGRYLAGAGDVNDDGFDDILIGSPYCSQVGYRRGKVYLVFGKASGWVMDLDLSQADASFVGEVDEDYASRVAGAGDVNGDGFDDILIGAPGNDDNGEDAGKAYLILGKAAGWANDVDLAGADASFLGEASDDYSGMTVAGVGDVDDDGYDDFGVGAPFRDNVLGYGTDFGMVYLVLGKAAGWSLDVDLGTADASFLGEGGGDEAGAAIAAAGDVNADGYDDFVIGAPEANVLGYASDVGKAYLLLGNPVGWAIETDLETADASFVGEYGDDTAGASVAGPGDVDGDGYDDLVIGAPHNSDIADSAGKTYLVRGRASGWVTDEPLEDAYASFLGEAEHDRSAEALSGAGDVNGDGYGDFLVSAAGHDDHLLRVGKGYLLLGCADLDLDGYTACGGPAADPDCDEGDPAVHPEADEACDGIDTDCDGVVPADEVDDDGDGYVECTDWTGTEPGVVGGGDCDDGDPLAHPDGVEVCDGVDQDCDMEIDEDFDGDGDGVSTCGADGDPATAEDNDCDDNDDQIHPGAPELCDGLDNDCDGVVPTGQPDGEFDDDGDSFPECLGDCDDADPLSYPGATELCDGVDNDCDGWVPLDEADHDFDGLRLCDGDCDDVDPQTYPGAPEQCDGEDNDCDGVVPVDESDDDGDGWSPCDGDCDDSDPARNPGHAEDCDGVDNDCDLVVPPDEADDDGDLQRICDGDCDDADPTAGEGFPELCDGVDNDCDGAVPADEADDDADGFRGCDGDCDDANPVSYPGASEGCDGQDNDCDGVTPADEADDDGDGHRLCDGDCDDAEATVYLGAPELCDGLDNDCDGVADEDVAVDLDGDGFTPCEGDCDDGDPDVCPDALQCPEICDGQDNDCDGTLPPDESDADADGHPECGDCDDGDPGVHPGAAEVCNGIDDDCDGAVPGDEVDDDGDGYRVCDGDCDDAHDSTKPGAHED